MHTEVMSGAEVTWTPGGFPARPRRGVAQLPQRQRAQRVMERLNGVQYCGRAFSASIGLGGVLSKDLWLCHLSLEHDAL
ncbi:hypothetical protein OH77DRAFT_1431180 [Trametes cingulata]|nr:hypothetical protein OH77DRAFT_1432002 [Trametes cingulata]KAI0350310.1 hypothetical protein OH77DRAFT_1431180 [Trametes cingulata]